MGEGPQGSGGLPDGLQRTSTELAPSGVPEPVTVHLDGATLDDLRNRLRRTRWPQTLPGVGWSRGVPTDYLRPLVEYWATAYDPRRVEFSLNAVPQVVVEIDGQLLHALHARSA